MSDIINIQLNKNHFTKGTEAFLADTLDILLVDPNEKKLLKASRILTQELAAKLGAPESCYSTTHCKSLFELHTYKYADQTNSIGERIYVHSRLHQVTVVHEELFNRDEAFALLTAILPTTRQDALMFVFDKLRILLSSMSQDFKYKVIGSSASDLYHVFVYPPNSQYVLEVSIVL